MHFILEAFFVGIFSAIIYILCSPFISNFFILLLVVGAIKHLAGNVLGIQSYYCSHGYACKKVNNEYKLYKVNNRYLFAEAFAEAGVYVIIGTILRTMIKTNMVSLYVLIGIVAHIFSEVTPIHTMFCKYNCI
jgi:hypothetical protein